MNINSTSFWALAFSGPLSTITTLFFIGGFICAIISIFSFLSGIPMRYPDCTWRSGFGRDLLFFSIIFYIIGLVLLGFINI